MSTRRWRHPGNEALAKAVPFLPEPVEFLLTKDAMWEASRGESRDTPVWNNLFHLYRGRHDGHRPLPWIDKELVLVLAINREDAPRDCSIALDFRTGFDNPRVVASHWPADDNTHHWREAFRCFSDFVDAIRL